MVKKTLEINTELLPNITVLGAGEYILIQFGVLIQKLGGDVSIWGGKRYCKLNINLKF